MKLSLQFPQIKPKLYLILMVAFISCPKTASALSVDGTYGLEFATRFLEINKDGAWPGYLVDKPLLIYSQVDKIAVLVNFPNRPQGYRSLKENPAISFKPNQETVFSAHSMFDFEYRWRDISVVFWKLDADRDINAELEVLFHEYFHQYQQKNFRVSSPPATPKMSNNALAYLYLETLVLSEALIRTGKEQEDLIKDFIALRKDRVRWENPDIIEWDAKKEIHEGSAEYVGLKSLISGTVKNIATPMVLAPEVTGFSPFVYPSRDAFINTSRYKSGLMQMLILDSLRIPWKHRLENGDKIFEILSGYFAVHDRSKRLKTLKKKYDFKTLGNLGYQDSETNESEDMDVIRQFFDSRRLLIRLPPGIKGDGPRPFATKINFKKTDIYIDAAVHLPRRKSLELRADSSMLSFGPSKVPFQSGEATIFPVEYGISIEETSKLNILIDGKKVQHISTQPKQFLTIRIDGKEVTLHAERPGSLFEKDNVISVIFEPK